MMIRYNLLFSLFAIFLLCIQATYTNAQVKDSSINKITDTIPPALRTRDTIPNNNPVDTTDLYKELDDVVVVGFGTVRKRDLTGSVATIDNTKLSDLPNTNIIQALRGSIPGVRSVPLPRPGASAGVSIRGQNSITASTNALIVVDGVVFNGDVGQINTNDVQSIDVLKDASASSIYGARGANGVVIITTKKGSTEKAQIGINAYGGFQYFDNNVKIENAEQYINKILDYQETRKFRGANVVIDRNNPENIAGFLSENERKNFLNGIVNDPFKTISQNASIQNYELNISAAAKKWRYFLSGYYTDQNGVLKNDQFKRYGGRVNLETAVTNWLKIGTNSFFSFRDYSGIEANMVDAYKMTPYAPFYTDETKETLKYRPIAPDLLANPLFPTRAINMDKHYNLFSLVYVDLNIPFIKGLNYRFNYSNELYWKKNYNFVPSYKIASEGANIEASAMDRHDETRDTYVEHIVKYAHRFGMAHDFDATFVYNFTTSRANGLIANANTFPNDDLIYYSLSLGKNSSSSAYNTRYQGDALMLRLNYKFNNKYLFTLTGRRDGASVFSRNNKYGYFPSAAAAWVISEEKFFRSVKPVNFLKVRVSYGASGNQAIDRYGSLSKIIQTSNYVYGDGGETAQGLAVSSLGNPDLKWETTKSFNIGLDAELLQGRIKLTADHYRTQTSDLLLTAAIPSMNGFSTVLRNVGALKNSGFEVTLTTINIQTRNVQWTTSINAYTNTNRLTKLYGYDLNKDGKEDDDIANSLFIGQSIGAIYDYTKDGIWQIGDDIPAGYRPGDFRIVDINGNGQIDPGDRSVVGVNRSKWFYGFNTSLSYKNFNLMVIAQAQTGGLRDNELIDPSKNGATSHRYILKNWWTPNNQSNTNPSLDYQNPLGIKFLEKTNFLRLQDISLSYTLPQTLVQKAGMQNVRIYVSSKNPYLFTKWSGWDPENGSSGATYYPQFKTIVAGLNITF